jgi:GNAT superfamily N-acetyltransferase
MAANPPAEPTQPNDLVIRPALPEDNARCQEIAMAAWEPIYASSRAALGDAIFNQLHPDGLSSKARQIASAFHSRPDWILVALAHDQGAAHIVGFATFRLDHERKVGEIGNNAVDPAWRGRGIAGALYERVLDRFRDEGMTVARVTTGLDDAHAPARAAYKKVRFERGTQNVTYYREL